MPPTKNLMESFKNTFTGKKPKNGKLVTDAVKVISEINTPSDSSQEIEAFNAQMTTRNSELPLVVGMTQMQFTNNNGGIHIGNVFNVNSSGSNSRSSSKPGPVARIQKTRTIQTMMNSIEPISDKLLDVISGNLGLRWKELMMLLGVHNLERERAWIDYKDEGVKEVIYTLLENHFQSHPEKRTIGYITTILWNNEFRETVVIVKEKYKTMRS